jgi:GDPmannose 4,6-dehydratase
LDWEKHVKTDPRYVRPSEVNFLLGDASKVKQVLGWEATVRFDDLVALMVDADIAALDDQLSGRAARRERGGRVAP